jgi:hypothetical protein
MPEQSGSILLTKYSFQQRGDAQICTDVLIYSLTVSPKQLPTKLAIRLQVFYSQLGFSPYLLVAFATED